MITAGVDVGNKLTRAIILKDGRIVARGEVMSGFDLKQAAEDAFNRALSQAGLNRADVQFVMATGTGKEMVAFAGATITDVSAAARGARFVCPTAGFVVDVGAEEGRVARIDNKGKVVDFVVSEKCAAGTGAFVETMSRALEVPLEEMGSLSLQSDKAVTINAQCAVFAESEVISLIHARTPKWDISRAVHDAIVSRIISMVRRVGLEKDLVIIGGMAKNPGFIRSMEEGLEIKSVIPEYPDYVSAVGAAAAAAEKLVSRLTG